METMSSFIRRATPRFRSAVVAYKSSLHKQEIKAARDLFREFSVIRGGGAEPYLLSTDSAKLEHNATSEFADSYWQVVMYLSPASTSGIINVCPWSTKGCRAVCLHEAGRLGLPPAQLASLIRTEFMVLHPREFALVLMFEVHRHAKRCHRKGVRPVVRLNGTSDISWVLLFPDLFKVFRGVQFFDYSKQGMNNLMFDAAHDAAQIPSNYYIVRSATERTPRWWVSEARVNVVVPFKVKRDEPLPATFMGKPVIDGDLHDLRFADLQGGYIVGVRGKGKGMHDTSGFVVEVQ